MKVKKAKKISNSKKFKADEALNYILKNLPEIGKILLKHQSKISSLKITVKTAQGIASTADYASEKALIKLISKKYPSHEFLAEESAYLQFDGESKRLAHFQEKEWVWIIDPLDGTNNFLNGLDYYAICVSLCHWGEPVLGVVYRPVTGECFYALKGKGSKKTNLNNKKVRPSSIVKKSNEKKLSDSLLVTGFTTEKGVLFDQEFELFKKMMGKSRGIRRMGSAALDLCYVASGVFDCFWERGLAPWDVAASGLICLEAGVQVTNYEQQSFHPFQESILAARNPLRKMIVEQITPEQ